MIMSTATIFESDSPDMLNPIFPDTIDGKVCMSLHASGVVKIEVYNSTGQLVDEGSMFLFESDDKVIRYNSRNLENGCYYIRLISIREVRTYRFVKE
jgi:hypothetical protein